MTPDLKLKWRPTWPDKADDFSAWQDERRAGRIYRSISAGSEVAPWRWFCHGELPGGRLGAGSGCEWSARQAAAELESSWFDALARCSDRPGTGS